MTLNIKTLDADAECRYGKCLGDALVQSIFNSKLECFFGSIHPRYLQQRIEFQQCLQMLDKGKHSSLLRICFHGENTLAYYEIFFIRVRPSMQSYIDKYTFFGGGGAMPLNVFIAVMEQSTIVFIFLLGKLRFLKLDHFISVNSICLGDMKRSSLRIVGKFTPLSDILRLYMISWVGSSLTLS